MNQYKITFKDVLGSVTLTADDFKEALSKVGSLKILSISEVSEPKEQKDLESTLLDTSYSEAVVNSGSYTKNLLNYFYGNTEGMEVAEWAKAVAKEDAHVSTPLNLGAVIEDSFTAQGSSLGGVVTSLVKGWGGALQAVYNSTERSWETKFTIISEDYRFVKNTSKLLSSGIYKLKDLLAGKPTVNWCSYFTKLDTLMMEKKITYMSIMYCPEEELFAIYCSNSDIEEKTYGNTFETALRNMYLSLK